MARARNEQVEVGASLDSQTYRPYQKLALKVRVTIAPGLHVYATPVPDEYTALTLDVESAVPIEVGAYAWPAAHPLQIEGLDEQFLVYEGTVETVVPCVILSNAGDLDVSVRVRYQACSAVECFPPTEIVLNLPLKGLDLIRD
jgi:DsbC/DsbD-like thiol-disulfide interchange protein